jgi:hypothetical protein
MSAAWGSTEDMDSIPRLKRAWRLWTYVSIGSIFYLLLHLNGF